MYDSLYPLTHFALLLASGTSILTTEQTLKKTMTTNCLHSAVNDQVWPHMGVQSSVFIYSLFTGRQMCFTCVTECLPFGLDKLHPMFLHSIPYQLSQDSVARASLFFIVHVSSSSYGLIGLCRAIHTCMIVVSAGGGNRL